MSSKEVIAREAAALVRDTENRPGYWRPFVTRHLAVTAIFVGAIAVLGAFGYGSPAGTVLGIAFALVVMAVLTALDLWSVRRRLRRTCRARTEASCPPGTLVRAVWTPEWFLYRLPSHELRVDLATIASARHDGGILTLEQGDGGLAWVVPDELVGAGGMSILRTALGERLREPL